MLATVRDVGDGSNGPEPMTVSIYDLRRDGPFVTLDFGIRCQDPSAGCGAGSLFGFKSLAEENTPATIKTLGNTAAGVMLIDPSRLLEYQTVEDSLGRPFASSLPFSIGDSLLHLAWVTFPAPPPTVSTMTVAFPMGGPEVPGVPITAGPDQSPLKPGPDVVGAAAAPFPELRGGTQTAGLTLPVENLVSTVGNTAGSDSEGTKRETIMLRSDVLFPFNKSSLTPRAHAVLAEVASRIRQRATGVVNVTGYTDSIGTDQVNIPLSQARAASVVAALKPPTVGVHVRYLTSGLGSSDPVAPNTLPNGADNPAGRALNRRVTIVFSVTRPAAPAPPPAAPAAAPATGQSRSTMFSAAQGSGGADLYRVTVDGLYRNGDTIALELTVTCQSATNGQASSNSNCSGDDFTGTPTVPPIPASQQFSFQDQGGTASAIYLSDPGSGTEYIVLRDADGLALTSAVNPSIRTGDSYPLWLDYPSPPPSTTSLTIVLPGASARIGPLPISSTPPATG